MPKPVPGKQYTVVTGDNLTIIAAKAYGNGNEWRRIWAANKNTLRSGAGETTAGLSGADLVFPGEIIFIPGDPVIEEIKEDINKTKYSNKSKDEFTLLLNSREVKVTSGSLVRTMDTAADGATASIPWQFGEDLELDKAIKPKSYGKSLMYFGNELKLTGFLYKTSTSLTKSGSKADLEIWSKTADFIDSTLKPPLEKNNVTLLQRSSDLASNSGIKAVLDDGVNQGGKFDRMTGEITDANFFHIKKYAEQRGLLVSSTVSGDVLLTQAKVNSPSIGVLEESQFNSKEFKFEFDGRKLFNVFTAVGQSPKSGSKEEVSKDDNIPRSRFFTFKANDTTTGDQKNAADWRRNKQYIEALTMQLPVSSWYGPNDELWEENTIVTIKSPTMFIPDGFDFIINKVEYLNSVSGTTAVLSILPPNAYTTKIIEDPWS